MYVDSSKMKIYEYESESRPKAFIYGFEKALYVLKL